MSSLAVKISFTEHYTVLDRNEKAVRKPSRKRDGKSEIEKVWNAIKDFIPKYLCNIMNFTYRYHIWVLVRFGCWMHMLDLVINRDIQQQQQQPRIALFIRAKWIEIESILYCMGRLANAVCNGTKWFRRCLKYDTENSSW